MSIRPLFVLAGLIIVLWPASAASQDIEHGRAVVAETCVVCHPLAGSGGSAQSLRSIAERPGITHTALVVWLTSTPHPTMPNLILQAEQASDVAAYILSLRGKVSGEPIQLRRNR